MYYSVSEVFGKRKLYIIFQREEKHISDFEKENDLLIIAGVRGRGSKSQNLLLPVRPAAKTDN